MKISEFDIQLSAGHRAEQSREVKESLRAWVGERRPDFEGRAARRPAEGAHHDHRVSISERARAAQAATASEEADAPPDQEPTLDLAMSVLRALTEMLTGRRVKIFDPRALEHADNPPAAPSPASQPAPQRAGFGIEYDRVERVVEQEQTRFSAAGRVSTSDGREIRFKVDLSLARSFESETRVSLRAGDAVMQDPLVLNFDGAGARLGSERVRFDLNADGTAEEFAQLAAGSGFLALDLNDNQQIDDGSELFGPSSGNGFAELAAHDEDGNGWIDESDSVFNRLSVWRPGGAPVSLVSSGVGALYLSSAASPFALRDSANQSLGALRSSGIYLKEDGSAGLLQQIDLAV